MIIFIRVDHHHVYTLVKNVIILFGFSFGVKMSGHLLAPELNYRFLIMNAQYREQLTTYAASLPYRFTLLLTVSIRWHSSPPPLKNTIS